MNIKFYIPLIIFNLYILLSLFLFIYSPVLYVDVDYFSVLLFMVSFLVMFNFGFFWGVNKRNLYQACSYSHDRKIFSSVKLCVVLSFLFVLLELLDKVASSNLNFSLSKMGDSYFDFYSTYERGGGSYKFIFVAKIIFYFPYLISIILGSAYYKRLNKKYKFMFVMVVFLTIFVHVLNEGKQKQLGDLVLLFLSVFLVLSVHKRRKFKKIIIKSCCFLPVIVLMFSYVLKSRYESINVNVDNVNDKVASYYYYDLDHVLFRVVDSDWALPVVIFSQYFSGGYYGLSLALNESFVWTYFIGHSYSAMIFVNKFLNGPSLLNDTYIIRMGEFLEWDVLTKWHTVFPWFASDFTFPGTIVFFSMVGYIYGVSWKESYIYLNPISTIFFSILSLGLAYVPANNQLFHTPEGCLSTLIIVLCWLIFHKKYNYKCSRLYMCS